MATDQYHEPVEELSPEIRTFIRMCISAREELEAIDWYTQRIFVEKDEESKKIISNARKEEMKHFSMNLEKIFRMNEQFRNIAKAILFQPGDVVENGEKAEDEND